MISPFPHLIVCLLLAWTAAIATEAVGGSDGKTADVTPAPASAPAARMITVACVGDSITAGYGLSDPGHQSYPAVLTELLGSGYRVRHCGHSGATAGKLGDLPYWSQWAYTASIRSSPDVVVIMLGTNDGKTANWTAEHNDFAADYATLIATYANLPSQPRVIVALPPPVYGAGAFGISPTLVEREVRPVVRAAATSAHCQIVDVHDALSDHPEWFPDTVHPNADGARRLAQVIAEAITHQPGR